MNTSASPPVQEPPATEHLLAVLEHLGLVPRLGPNARRMWGELWGQALLGRQDDVTVREAARQYSLSRNLAAAVLEMLVYLGGFKSTEGPNAARVYSVSPFDRLEFRRVVVRRIALERDAGNVLIDLAARQPEEERHAWRTEMVEPIRAVNCRLRELGLDDGDDATIRFSALDAAFHALLLAQAGLKSKIPDLLLAFTQMNFLEIDQQRESVAEQHDRIIAAIEQGDVHALDIALHEHSDHVRRFPSEGRIVKFRGVEPIENEERAAADLKSVSGGTFVYLTRNAFPREISEAGDILRGAIEDVLQDEDTVFCYLVASPSFLEHWANQIGRPSSYYEAYSARLSEMFEQFCNQMSGKVKRINERVRIYYYDSEGDFRNPNESHALCMPPNAAPRLTARGTARDGAAGPIGEPNDSVDSVRTFIAVISQIVEELPRETDSDANFLSTLSRRLSEAATATASMQE